MGSDAERKPVRKIAKAPLPAHDRRTPLIITDDRTEVGEVQRLLNSLSRFPILSAAENTTLFRAYDQERNPDKPTDHPFDRDSFITAIIDPERQDQFTYAFARSDSIRDLLIYGNRKLLVSIAQRHYRNRFSFIERVEAGMEGLINAVDGFDHHRGFTFSTYATTIIKNEISRYVQGQTRQIYPVLEPTDSDTTNPFVGPPNDTEFIAIPRAMVSQILPFIRSLPPKEARALMEYLILDRTQSDIAGDEKVTKMAINLRIQSALRKIRATLNTEAAE